MITCITTTSGRPYTFNILTKWMSKQTLQPDRWIVVTDSYAGYSFPGNAEVIRRKRKPLDNSLCENWLKVLPKLGYEGKCIVVEDDDYINPQFIETMSLLLDRADLVGLSKCLYYSIRDRKFRRCHNTTYSLLACTAFDLKVKDNVQGEVMRCKAGNSYSIDILLWQSPAFISKLLLDCESLGKPLHVGMKGMPGKPGLGMGLKGVASNDKNFAILDSWIGQDSKIYKAINWEEHDQV